LALAFSKVPKRKEKISNSLKSLNSKDEFYDEMLPLTGFDFCDTFDLLHEHYKLNREEAYNISLRAHRGGGFTKDYIYLTRLKKI
jgi:hypothetical protein